MIKNSFFYGSGIIKSLNIHCLILHHQDTQLRRCPYLIKCIILYLQKVVQAVGIGYICVQVYRPHEAHSKSCIRETHVLLLGNPQGPCKTCFFRRILNGSNGLEGLQHVSRNPQGLINFFKENTQWFRWLVACFEKPMGTKQNLFFKENTQLFTWLRRLVAWFIGLVACIRWWA